MTWHEGWRERARRRLRLWRDRGGVEREMDDEMRFHLEMEAADRLREGLPPDEARRAARRAFGGVERFKEEARDARGGRLLDDVAADVRYAARGLRRSPGFALTAILTLGLGIGATSAVFGAANAVLRDPLPYPAPERLVRIFMQNSPTNRWTVSNADWQGIRAHQTAFAAVALLQPGGAALSGGGRAEWVRTGRVTADFFRTLGVSMTAGAGFRAGDDAPGATPTVVVAERFAARHFGDAAAVGRTLVLDRVSHTVVGVLAGGEQAHAGVRAEVWPILQLPTPTRRGPFGYVAVGRLRDGITLAAARRDLVAVSDRIFDQWSDGFGDRSARLTPYALHEVIVGDASRPIAVLAAAVALVLLVAVANVANLVLVRSVGRTRELAVRTALGARRARLARLLLTESLILGALGAIAGVAVAFLGLEALRALGPQLPRLDAAALDGRAVAFALGTALVAGVLVGFYPLVALARAPAESMRAGDRRTGADRGTRLLQGTLVAAEFALALPLLVGAGLLLESLVRLQRVDPGFDPRGVLTARVSLPAVGYDERVRMQRFWDDALRAVATIPGVASVGLTSSLPPDNGGDSNNFDVVERPVAPGTAEPVAPWSWVTPELLPTLGVRLVEGRLLAATDDSAAPPVVVVSRAFAERHLPGQRAVGKRLVVGGCRECEPSTIVGVVEDVKYEGLAGSGVAAYEPVRQGPRPTSLHLVVRTTVAPTSVVGAIREQLRALDPDVPLRDVATMEDRLAGSIATPRRLAWLLGGFAAAAAALAALGVFGVMSYAVAQQRREIGVRLALGADTTSVVGMVVRRGMLRAAAGLAVGLLLSLLGARVLQAVLFEVRPTDPATLAAGATLLALVALLACWLPGRRAAAIRPVEALGGE